MRRGYPAAKMMMGAFGACRENLDSLKDRYQQPGDRGLAGKANEAGLGDRARCPALLMIGLEPRVRGLVMQMIGPRQRQQDIDVKQMHHRFCAR